MQRLMLAGKPDHIAANDRRFRRRTLFLDVLCRYWVVANRATTNATSLPAIQ
jgi:hypothetical protein